MSDWRTIVNEQYNDRYSYHVFHDPEFDVTDDYKNFEIWATQGSTRYIPVDRVIDPANSEEVEQMLGEAKAYVPLYLFAHSNVRVSTIPFGDPWDSGQCGFAVIPASADTDEDAMGHDWNAQLNDMVKQYDAAINGQVVGWTITKHSTCSACKHSNEDVVDGVSGYLQVDYKGIDAIIQSEIIPAIEAQIAEERRAEHGPDSVTAGDD